MCTGPARAAQEVRLGRAEKRESGRFVRDYNDRLFNGLVIVSLAQILLFRFVIRISLLETLGWLAFAFLQVTSTLKDCFLHCSILAYWTYSGDLAFAFCAVTVLVGSLPSCSSPAVLQ